MNSQEYRTSTTVSLFLALGSLVDAGSASTFGHLCAAAMKVALKCRKKGTPAPASGDLQPELEQRESRLLGMVSCFAHQIQLLNTCR